MEKYPLHWPENYPRTKHPKPSQFSAKPFGKCRDDLFKQLKLMLDYQENKTVVLSTNVPLKNDGLPYASFGQPEDKGVAVYFLYQGESIVICCDKWDKIEHNLWACARTIEALRGIERWGVSDFLKRSFTGFQALPPASGQSKKEWWQVLGYRNEPEAWASDDVEIRYRSLAKKMHPDAGGSVQQFQELYDAYQQARKYLPTTRNKPDTKP